MTSSQSSIVDFYKDEYAARLVRISQSTISESDQAVERLRKCFLEKMQRARQSKEPDVQVAKVYDEVNAKVKNITKNLQNELGPPQEKFRRDFCKDKEAMYLHTIFQDTDEQMEIDTGSFESLQTSNLPINKILLKVEASSITDYCDGQDILLRAGDINLLLDYPCKINATMLDALLRMSFWKRFNTDENFCRPAKVLIYPSYFCEMDEETFTEAFDCEKLKNKSLVLIPMQKDGKRTLVTVFNPGLAFRQDSNRLIQYEDSIITDSFDRDQDQTTFNDTLQKKTAILVTDAFGEKQDWAIERVQSHIIEEASKQGVEIDCNDFHTLHMRAPKLPRGATEYQVASTLLQYADTYLVKSKEIYTWLHPKKDGLDHWGINRSLSAAMDRKIKLLKEDIVDYQKVLGRVPCIGDAEEEEDTLLQL